MPPMTIRLDPESTQIALFSGIEPTNTYRKAVQVVHSKPSQPLSLIQGKLSNCWLKHAYDSEPDKEGWWAISFSKMAQEIGFDSNNRDYLRNSALELMKIVFEYDVISKTNQRLFWKASVLFPDIEIQDGSVRYQISGQLKERVLNPDMYALVDLNVLRRFQRASSIPIYEHCVRFVNLGKTAEVELTTFRDIVLGSKSHNSAHTEYKYFKQRVLRPSITEINTFSEIVIELVEGYSGRRVSTIQFFVKRKTKNETPVEDAQEVEEITKSLTDFGLRLPVIKKLVKQYSGNELLAALEYTKKRLTDKRTPVDNPSAYFQRALEQRWGIVDEPAVVDPKPTLPRKPVPNSRKNINEAFLIHQISEAGKYFDGQDGAEQETLVVRYNEQVTMTSLRFNSKRRAKAAQTAFFQWLAIETWGVPTAERLLDFAETLVDRPKTD